VVSAVAKMHLGRFSVTAIDVSATTPPPRPCNSKLPREGHEPWTTAASAAI